MDQRRLHRSHKVAEESESTWAYPLLTAYSSIVWCSGSTEEDGQPLLASHLTSVW